MALIDVIKCDIQDGEFCYKFPSDDLRLGSQLVVYPSQTAFFVKGGEILDSFSSGTYTISSENIPLLNNPRMMQNKMVLMRNCVSGNRASL